MASIKFIKLHWATLTFRIYKINVKGVVGWLPVFVWRLLVGVQVLHGYVFLLGYFLLGVKLHCH